MTVVPVQLLEEIKRIKAEQMQNPRLPPNPQVTDVAQQQSKMHDILENSTLSESEKAQRYGETLFKLQNSLEKVKVPGNNIPLDYNQKAVSDTMQDRILQSVPKTMQRKASLLLDMLKDNNNLTWNNQGVVTYKGTQIPGSNIIDLINDTLRQRKGVQPKGWETFSKVLNETNVPQEVVGNLARWRWMHKHDDSNHSDSENEVSFSTPRISTRKASKRIKSLSQVQKASPYSDPVEKERLKQYYTQELLTPPSTVKKSTPSIKKRSILSNRQRWDAY